MRTALPALLLGLTLAAPAPAQEKPTTPPKAHRLEIYNGNLRTAFYFGPGDQAALRAQERAENDAALADAVAALRLQYVHDEAALQARRRAVQQLLYGYSTQYFSSLYPAAGYAFGFGGYPYGAYGSFYPGWGGGVPYTFGNPGITTHSLAFGMGDEGIVKAAVVQGLAGGRGAPQAGGRVAVFYRLGDRTEKVEGTLVREDADWLVLATPNGETSIRGSEVIRMDRLR